MTSKHPEWKQHLDGIADELVRLSAICDVDLSAPGTIDRILQGDESVCGRKSETAFGQLRKLLAATYVSLNKALDLIGADDVKALTNEIMERVNKHRTAGGQPPPQSSNPLIKG